MGDEELIKLKQFLASFSKKRIAQISRVSKPITGGGRVRVFNKRDEEKMLIGSSPVSSRRTETRGGLETRGGPKRYNTSNRETPGGYRNSRETPGGYNDPRPSRRKTDRGSRDVSPEPDER